MRQWRLRSGCVSRVSRVTDSRRLGPIIMQPPRPFPHSSEMRAAREAAIRASVYADVPTDTLIAGILFIMVACLVGWITHSFWSLIFIGFAIDFIVLYYQARDRKRSIREKYRVESDPEYQQALKEVEEFLNVNAKH